MNDIEPIDVVYTWVDDQFPGYRELLGKYAQTGHDTNPNRTRDNLDLLKYSLRSLQMYCPWVRKVYLFTCRPQIPQWLNPQSPGLELVHHDQVIDAQYLPTFNSFAIVSHLHRIPGVSARFLYVEDDILFAAPTPRSHFIGSDGRIEFYPRLGITQAPEDRDSDSLSPWNTSLAYANHLLDERFAPARRHTVNHVPLMVDRDAWAAMTEQWPEAFHHTRASRFRDRYNVPPEYLYPHYMAATGRGRMLPYHRSYRRSLYHPLENLLPWAWWGMAAITLLRPNFFALNDNFGDYPNRGVVAAMRRFMERRYPHKSRFER